MFVHTHNGLAFDKPVAEFEAGLGVEPAVPGVVGALTGVTRVLRSNRKTFKLSYKNTMIMPSNTSQLLEYSSIGSPS